MLIYVDDILIASTNTQAIDTCKAFLHSQFHMKDMVPVRYFLGIEVDHSSQGFFLSQKSTFMTCCKNIIWPIVNHSEYPWRHIKNFTSHLVIPFPILSLINVWLANSFILPLLGLNSRILFMPLVSLCTNPPPYITKLLSDFYVILKGHQPKVSSLLTIHLPFLQLFVIVIGHVVPTLAGPLVVFVSYWKSKR